MAEAQESLDVSDLKENFLECSVCLEHFDQGEKRPRLLLNCLHSFCTHCLEQLLKKEGGGHVTCPNCRQLQKVKGTAQSLPIDPVRNKLVDFVRLKKGKKIPCTDCPDGSDAVARCHECQSYMCTPCKEAHKRNRLSRKHTCQSLEEALNEPVKNFLSHRCEDHSDYKVEFYCGKCSSLCCISCFIVKHKGHDLDPIEDAANSMLSLLKARMEDVEKSASVLRRKKSSIEEKSQMQVVNLKHTTDTINKTFDELIGKLNGRRNKLTGELKERTEITVNALKKQQEATEDSLAQIDSTLEYFKQIESKSDDCEVLSAGPVLVQSLEAAAAVDQTEDVQHPPTWTFTPGQIDCVISKVGNLEEVKADTSVLNSQANMDNKSSGKGSLIGRKRTGSSNTISEGMLRAVRHLIGEQFDACCDVEVDKTGARRIFFVVNDNASIVEKRIQGMILEEEPAKDADKERANKVAEQAMKESMNMYIEYQPDRQTILVVGEDWTLMDKARKKVVSLFGQSKVSSRGTRHFKNTPVSNTKASSSVGPKEMSFDYDNGCAKGTHIEVKVYQADITKLSLDAIVNAATGDLYHGGGVARAISSAAGSKMTTESHEYKRKFGEIKVSEVGVTSGGKLPYKVVFHAVGPRWEEYGNKSECLEDLCKTILRCLCEADKWGVSSIAIPSISAAIFRIPKEKCVAMYVRALKSFDKVIKQTCLTEVHFVDITDEMVYWIREELKAKWQLPSDSNDLDKDSAFIEHCLSSRPAYSVGIAPMVKSSSSSLQLEEQHSAGAQSQQGPGDIAMTKFHFNEDVSVTVIKDNIFKVEANALVSWEESGSSLFLHPFQKSLLFEGGKNYEDKRKKKIRNIKKGDVVSTTSDSLIPNQVLHACVGMMTTFEDFVSLVTKLFKDCMSWNYTSVLLPVFMNFSSTVKVKKPVTLFMKTVVDVLTKLSQDKNGPVLRVIIVDQEEKVVQDLTSALSQYLISLGLAQNSDRNYQEGKNCPICLDKITEPEQLACGHGFCKECLKVAFESKKACPICGKLYGPIFGTMPVGTMRDKTEGSSLPGFPGYGTIVITYSIPDGIQTGNHPHPGKPYRGARRTTYLPDSPEGREVLELLKVAWERKLTFTIDQSVTIGDGLDSVTWNEIHHKTSITGGESNHGYPDPCYLTRVKEELAAQGVTVDDLGAAGTV